MYRVVVADDDGKACKKAVEFLQNNGYQVVGEAADGLEAVMVCRRERPDFVIMDLSMPVMTGLEAIRGDPQGEAGRFYHCAYFLPQ